MENAGGDDTMEYDSGYLKEERESGSLRPSRVVRVSPVGKVPTYNLTMKEPWHNYFANGILTANSHSVCYGILAYRMAYLKAHYPVHFWAAVLTNDGQDSERAARYIAGARQQGVTVVGPDINCSEYGFTVSGNTIRFGLMAVRGVGQNSVRALLESRNRDGAFTSLQNVIDRTDHRVVNRRVLESLIKSGAMDSLPGTRAGKMLAVETLAERGEKRNDIPGQQTLFGEWNDKGSVEYSVPDVPEWSRYQLLLGEKESLGVYLSGHPLSEWREVLRGSGAECCVQVQRKAPGTTVRVGGMVHEIDLKITRRKERFAILRLEDETGEVEVIVWPGIWQKCGGYVGEGKVLLVEGKVEESSGQTIRVVAGVVEEVNMVSKGLPRNSGQKYQVVLCFPGETLKTADWMLLREIVLQYRGERRLWFELELETGIKARLRAAPGYNVVASRALATALEKHFPGVRMVCEDECEP